MKQSAYSHQLAFEQLATKLELKNRVFAGNSFSLYLARDDISFLIEMSYFIDHTLNILCCHLIIQRQT